MVKISKDVIGLQCILKGGNGVLIMMGVNQKEAWKIYHEKNFNSAELIWDSSKAYIMNVVHLFIDENIVRDWISQMKSGETTRPKAVL